ncbi:cytochrome P450 [Sporichthya sp.]|uniref:cytochrome P450 n=1 Tax=Sporichthya sp. TaxID=65475 RepID=UPI0018124B08|nr:cytochrome P450 [Sporichthya sp.]MBA3745075.1 cytochrome P450 [Sporichthya sp.]
MTTPTRPARVRARVPRQADVKLAVRWGIRQGLPAVGMKLGARSGDLFARLNADPALQKDPFPLYAQIRAQGDVVPGRYVYTAARYGVVSELLKSDAFRSGVPDEALPAPLRRALAWAIDPRAQPFTERPAMIMTNGAEHLRLRKVASRGFTPKAIDNLRLRTIEIADHLLDELDEAKHRDGSPADLVEEYANLLPVLVIAEVLGVPAKLQETFLGWGDRILQIAAFGVPFRTFLDIEDCLREMNTWLLGHFDYLRANPGENLLSRMVAASDAENATGNGLTETELMANAGLLLFAGFETTVNLIGSGALRLLAHPDQAKLLRDEPERWRNAIDEMLRLDGPAQFTVRHSQVATELRGVPVPKLRMIICLLAGANRDPAVFADPDRFDITRANARDHLALGAGVHFCLGASLARLEGEVALSRLFERFPNLAAAGAPTLGPNAALRGYIQVPATLGLG